MRNFYTQDEKTQFLPEVLHTDEKLTDTIENSFPRDEKPLCWGKKFTQRTSHILKHQFFFLPGAGTDQLKAAKLQDVRTNVFREVDQQDRPFF